MIQFHVKRGKKNSQTVDFCNGMKIKCTAVQIVDITQSISENHIVQCDVYIIYKDIRCRIYLNTVYSIRVVLLSLDYI